jgi:Secretion system C-terminal sorting domain/Concanavalin A-like lectin/glucanases superfamily
MKTKLLLALLCLVCSKVNAQAIINLSTHPTTPASKKSILDFGAIPNDGLDDTWAFIKAGRYFSNQWNINGAPLGNGAVNVNYTINSAELEIPTGTYNVGKQVILRNYAGAATTYGQVFNAPLATTPVLNNLFGSTNTESFFKYGFELIDLFNVDKLSIKGVGTVKPVIKYNDSLCIGYFDSTGNGHFWPTDTEYLNYQYQCSIGSFVNARNCKNIAVTNLDIDGSNTPFNAATNKGTIYKGGYGPSLIQAGGSGVFLTNTQNVTLQYLDIHHMTLDGLVLNDYYKDPAVYTASQPLSNLLADNLVCDNNRRQGFSWIGGKNILVSNSKFNNTSRSVTAVPLAAGNPAAGIDIEPEKDANGVQLLCADGIFNNCEAVNNRGCALVNSVQPLMSVNCTFNSCTFHDIDGYSVWAIGRNYTFNNSKIWGGFVYGNSGNVAGEETKFYGCDFADEELGGIYAGQATLAESFGSAKRLLFSGCTFTTKHPNVRLFSLYAPAAGEADFHVISNCTFTNTANSYAGTAGANYLFGCTFDGTNTFTNSNTTVEQVFSTNRLVFTGGADPCAPYQFNLNGKIFFMQANANQDPQLAIPLIMGRNGIGSTANSGYFNFNINDKSCLYTFWSSVYDIGMNSTFSNNAGGQWCMLGGAGASINNSGKIILNENSHTNFFNNPPNMAINTQLAGNPEFYYHKNAQMGLNATWTGYPSFVGIGTPVALENVTRNSLTKFDGGNTNIPATAVTSVNDALNFTGLSNSYVSIPDNSKFDVFKNGSSFAVELAFKSTATSSNKANILFSKGYGLHIGLVPTTASQNPGSVFLSTSNAEFVFPVGNYHDGKCHFISISYNSASANKNLRFSIDGVTYLYSVAPFSINATTLNGYPALIGSTIEFSNSVLDYERTYWKGWIGQVRVWSRALTQLENCHNYKRKAPYLATGLIGDWDMIDNSGTVVTDNAPNPVNGTLLGTASWLSQNEIGDCFTPQNNSNQLGNFRTSGDNPLVVKYYGDNNNLPAITASVAVTPNPNKGSFAVELKNITEPSSVIIKDMSGKTVYQQSVSLRAVTAPQTINVKNVPAGLYVLYVQNKKQVLTSKIVVQ